MNSTMSSHHFSLHNYLFSRPKTKSGYMDVSSKSNGSGPEGDGSDGHDVCVGPSELAVFATQTYKAQLDDILFV